MIQNNRAHADQRPFDGTAMKHTLMPNSHIVFHDRRGIVINVNDRSILNIGTRADFDAIGIASNHCLKPDRTLFPRVTFPTIVAFFATKQGVPCNEAGETVLWVSFLIVLCPSTSPSIHKRICAFFFTIAPPLRQKSASQTGRSFGFTRLLLKIDFGTVGYKAASCQQGLVIAFFNDRPLIHH